MKVLEENIGCKMPGIGFGNDFFESDTKSKNNKSKNKKVGPHQTEKLLHSKENQQNEKVPPEWEKIFASHLSDKGLTSKIHEKFTTQLQKQLKMG